MICPSKQQVSAYVAGTLTVGAASRMAVHLANCRRCHLRYDAAITITNALRLSPGEFTDETFLTDTWARIASADSPMRPILTPPENGMVKWRRYLPVAAAALILVGVMLFCAIPSISQKSPGYSASRGTEPHADRWVSVALFQRTFETTRYTRIVDRLVTGRPIAVAYEDRSSEPFPYLMVFGVDDTGRIYWLFPEYADVNENPLSIDARHDGGYISLPEEVTHDFHPGRVRFYGLFTRSPLDVRRIEADIRRCFEVASCFDGLDRIPSIEGGQWTQTVTVVSPDSSVEKRK